MTPLHETPSARTAPDLRHRPHWVYLLFNGAGEALYIGCTSNPARRYKEHRSARWFAGVDHVKLIGPFVGHLAQMRAQRREAALITEKQPRFNAHHRGRYLPDPPTTRSAVPA